MTLWAANVHLNIICRAIKWCNLRTAVCMSTWYGIKVSIGKTFMNVDNFEKDNIVLHHIYAKQSLQLWILSGEMNWIYILNMTIGNNFPRFTSAGTWTFKKEDQNLFCSPDNTNASKVLNTFLFWYWTDIHDMVMKEREKYFQHISSF